MSIQGWMVGWAILAATPVLGAEVHLATGVCGGTAHLDSSGYVFHRDGRVLVLASADFVLGSDTPGYCHRAIAVATGAEFALAPLAVDWASGLAVLEGPAELGAYASELPTAAPRISTRVSWAGGEGLIIAARSRRHHFATLPQVFEIKGDAIEARAPGGAIADARGEVVGFVASQWVEEVPGSGSRVVRWRDRAPTPARTLIGIPASAVAAWLARVTVPGWRPDFRIDPADQLARAYRLRVGPFALTEDCPPPGSPAGQPGYPIGGGDPVGVGGGSLAAPACNFTVTLSAPSEPMPAIRSDLWVKLRDHLARGTSVTVKGAYRRWEGELLNLGLVSLGHLAQSLLSPDGHELQPLLALTGPGTPAEPELAPMRACAAHFLRWVEGPFGSLGIRQRGYLLARLSLTEDWKSATLPDLEALYADAARDRWMHEDMLLALRALIDARRALGP